MKNRTCRQGRLFSATDTLEGFDSPVPNDTATFAIAMGADKTLRPASFFQVSIRICRIYITGTITKKPLTLLFVSG